ncbi:OsmC family protein [Aestuariibaculum suncheonense]|uniref:OsmC family protein n=1 Tax=Aestuariibaculum suncheonense TaxID=1028745 RepID=A0A8J6QI64_9FLAO|nr:OsmC family protein [Aestuariibaculum suncheonense]MBD0835551.1 OsmC family protein [Aestuariibaculum suncheonense]
MEYKVKASTIANQNALISIKNSKIDFGTTTVNTKDLPNPAELLLGSLAACILKNVERFSHLMTFTYTEANIEVFATRHENPPRMDNIFYKLNILSNDNTLNLGLLKRNLEKHGTIYNTLKMSCNITGSIKQL